MIKKILAAVDGSEHAWKALDLASDIAKQHRARLIVLHVVPFESVREFAKAEGLALEEETARFHSARTLGDRLTRSAEAHSKEKGLTDIVGRTAEGRPADQILEAAGGDDVDMIVMGSRGLTDTRALFPPRWPTSASSIPGRRKGERSGSTLGSAISASAWSSWWCRW